MASPLDAPLRSVAASLLAKFGRTITVNLVTAGTFTPSTGLTTGGGTAAVSCKGIAEDSQYTDDGGVQHASTKWTVAASAFIRQPNSATDTLVVGAKTYSIAKVVPVQSGELDALYQLHVAR